MAGREESKKYSRKDEKFTTMKKLFFHVSTPLYTVLFVMCCVAFLYFFTLPKNIGFGDAGTMATAAVTLGVAHPPGFPTYMLIGKLFSFFPFGSMLMRLQLVSVCSAVSLILVIFLLVYMTATEKTWRFWQALSTALFVALSYGVWSQAGNVESYIMTNLFMFGVIMLCLYNAPWWILGVILGLGGGLNPIGIAVLPVMLYVVKFSKKLLFLGIVAGITLILVYSYLPIRARAHPFVNWDNPQTVEAIIRHITGGGLNIQSATVVNGFTGSIQWFADAWMRFGYLAVVQLTPLILPIAGFGGWTVWKRNRKMFWVWMMLLVGNVSLAGLYVSGNRDIWMMTSMIVLVVLAGEGVMACGRWRVFCGIVLLGAVLWGSVPRTITTMKHDVSGFYLADLYRDIPAHAILIGGGETFHSLTLYAREVAKIRPDVIPVDMTIFYGQQWYRENLAKNTNLVIDGEFDREITFGDVDEFSRVLEKFAQDNVGRPIVVTGYLLMQPVYANTTLPAYAPHKFHMQRRGLVYQLVLEENAQQQDFAQQNGALNMQLTTWNPPSYLESNYQKAVNLIALEYALAFEKTGDYFLDLRDERTAFSWYSKAGDMAPSYFDQRWLREKAAKARSPNSPTIVPSER